MVESRGKFAAESFRSALISNDGTRRAIEQLSHDSERYIGDMLAWIHSSILGEKELLMSILPSDCAIGGKMHEDYPSIMQLLDLLHDSPVKMLIGLNVNSQLHFGRLSCPYFILIRGPQHHQLS